MLKNYGSFAASTVTQRKRDFVKIHLTRSAGPKWCAKIGKYGVNERTAAAATTTTK